MKFSIHQESDDYVVLSINGFEVHVFAEEGVLCAQIGKNGIVRAETDFGFDEQPEPSFWANRPRKPSRLSPPLDHSGGGFFCDAPRRRLRAPTLDRRRIVRPIAVLCVKGLAIP